MNAAALALAATIIVQPTSPVAQGATTPPTAPEQASAQQRGCRLPGPYDYPHGGQPVDLEPRDFTSRINHPYWPMRPGTVWRLVESSNRETQRIRVTVTHRTRIINGIRARVVHDVVRSEGAVIEDTLDWYAQDSGGSIWYLGEATKEYENGHLVSTEGSWEYGRDGAQAGILLPAKPHAGCAYREEFLAGQAEDRALILSRREAIKVPTGCHRHVLHTANTTPLTPGLLENKFYARGIGPVLEIDVSPTWSRAVLLDVNRR